MHERERENQKAVGSILKILLDNNQLEPDGMVVPDEFAWAKWHVDDLRKVFVRGADDEVERELFWKMRPYRDTDDQSRPPQGGDGTGKETVLSAADEERKSQARMIVTRLGW